MKILALFVLTALAVAPRSNVFTCAEIWSCFVSIANSTTNQISPDQATTLLQNAVNAGCRQLPTQTTGAEFVAIYDVDHNGYLSVADFGNNVPLCGSTKLRGPATAFCLCMNP